jgi:hypothetical protein
MQRRGGATLIEVLVAIFVMGIGLLALLVLFPLGAFNMAQALRADRCTQAALNAAAIARILPVNGNSVGPFGIRNDAPNVQNGYQTLNGTYPTTPPAGGPSYPVYVDPWGVKLTAATPAILGVTPPGMTGTVTGIARVSPTFFTAGSTPTGQLPLQLLITRWCTLLDDITFNDDGVPDNSQGNFNVQREGRYTWAWMLQIPSAATIGSPGWANTAVESVVVYEKRQLLSPVSGTQLPDEHSYQATFGNPSDRSDNSVTLIWDPSFPTPPVRRGNWVLDGTLTPGVHGYFYRVVDVGAVVGNGSGQLTMKLDLQTPLQAGTATGSGVAILIDDVVEVYYQGTN